MRQAPIKLLSVLACAVLAAAFIVTMHFAAPRIAAVPETTGEITATVEKKADGERTVDKIELTAGKDFAAVRITELGHLGKLSRVNYIPDRYVAPGALCPEIQIVDLSRPFDFAEKGTLMFVVMNLDPYDRDFTKKAESLNQYKIGDFWHFTLQLPKIFTASNVYDGATLVARNGEIENYEFIEFTTSYDKKTERLKMHAERTAIDLQFYTRRQAINPYRIITVHYQSTGSAYGGIVDMPLIGTETAVKSTTENSQTLLFTFAILSVLIFAVFCVTSMLEKSREFIAAIVWVFGIAVMLLANYFLGAPTAAPLFWSAVARAASFIVVSGSLLSLAKNVGKFPARIVCPAFSALGGLFAFITPFLPFAAARVLFAVALSVKAVSVAALVAFIVLSLFDKRDGGVLKSLCATLIAVSVIASLFLPQTFPAQSNPMFWLSAVTAVATFVSVFILFGETKKTNDYLNANLRVEVDRQLKDIRVIIQERDNLLQFVAHDMKKPLVTSTALLDTLIAREKDGEQQKALRIVKQNNDRVVTNLSEVGAYARFNYIAEPSQVVDLKELCALLVKYHALDCNANGIVLKNTVVKRYKVFAKRQALENAVSNIILNAVEHADCKTVTLSVKADRTHTVLSVTDDGKGIAEGMDVFKPYVGEKRDSGGLGLYICKNIVESMNGTLEVSSRCGNTVFSISLLNA